MKRILLIVLAAALMLSLCAGCNTGKRIVIDDDFDDDIGPIVIGGTTSNDSNVDDDKPHVDLPDGWPGVLPLYTDGVIIRNEQREYDRYSITIHHTSKAALRAYGETLSNDGWECTRDDEDGAELALMYYKDDRGVSLLLLDDGTSLLLTLHRVLESEELPNVWPAGVLPQGFPEYPDGEITRVLLLENGMIIINIEDSSKGSFDKYAATLKDAGWSLENVFGDEPFEFEGELYEIETWEIKKDGKFGDITFFEQGGKVDVALK